MINGNSEDREPEELKDAEFVQDDHNESPPSDIVAFNELRSCADLYRMHLEKSLDIAPDFQREFVWPAADQTRFIDSLVKQLPIPSLCLAFDYKTDRYIVIDGLQRLSTIIRFLSGDDWKLSSLDDIDPLLGGKHAASIKNDKGKLRSYFDRIQNRTLPLNVLRCDFSKRAHMEYIFTIFHRLNSGGVKLTNQEIRNSVFSGAFNELLQKLDNEPNWRKVNRMEPGKKYRLVKQEIILRFFAFLDNRASYGGQIAKFLNKYMFDNRHADEVWLQAKRETFDRVLKILGEKIFLKAPADRLPTSLLESVLVGIAVNLDRLELLPIDELQAKFATLQNSEEFVGEDVAEGLSKKDKVTRRFDRAVQIFAA